MSYAQTKTFKPRCPGHCFDLPAKVIELTGLPSNPAVFHEAFGKEAPLQRGFGLA
jgi:hypothetical protein